MMKKIAIITLLCLTLQAQALKECKSESDKINGCVEKWFYHQSKTLWREATYQNGVLNGVEKWYHKNGKIDLEVSYKEGKMEGSERGYFDNGTLRSEAFYKNGKLEGAQKFYYKNGKLEGEIPHQEGKINGVAKWYERNGDLWVSVEFKDNEPISGKCRDKTPLSTPQLNRIKQDSLLSSVRRICP